MDVSAFRQRIDQSLRGFLNQKQALFSAYTTDPLITEWLHEGERLVFAGGKRVRPLMLWLGYRLGGGTDEEAALRAGISLELFHLFALVHDDIMDGGLERHGVPTPHTYVAKRLADLNRRGPLETVARSQGIIVGDLLFSWSLEAFLTAGFAAAQLTEAQRYFFKMSDEVMVGQMLDVDLTTRAESSVEEVTQKMRLKTAGYTFTRPLQIGLALAGGPTDAFAFAEAFGSALGIAFQIQDDLLDVFGTKEETGKTALSDLREHQHSLLTQWVMDRGTEADRKALANIWGQAEPSAEGLEAIKAVFVRTGAFAFALEQCREQVAEAQTALANMTMSEDLRALFQVVFSKAIQPSLVQAIEYRVNATYARNA